MPTFALQAGEPYKLFDANSTAPVANSTAVAVPATLAKVITWAYSFASAPSGTSVKLQMSEDGTVWTDLDSGTNTAGETKTTSVMNAQFLRAQNASQTGGGALTVTATIGY